MSLALSPALRAPANCNPSPPPASDRPVAKRGSVLYFVIAGLANIDPMYQYSLEYFIKIFKIRLEKAPNPPELEARLQALIKDMTEAFYANICRGLFEKDKLLYSFLMAINIQLERKAINVREWTFFLRGSTTDIPVDPDHKIPSWISEKLFQTCLGLSKESSAFNDLPEALVDPSEQETWRVLLDVKQNIWEAKLPFVFQNKLDSFQRLLFLKQFREEKLLTLVKSWVGVTLGEVTSLSLSIINSR